VAKTPIDELMRVIKAARTLQEVTAKHDQAIARILDRLEVIETRLALLEQTRS
jgi:hypothetical protein